MTPDQVFALANAAALAGWVILIGAPRRWPWLGFVPRWLVPVALSIVYAVLLPANFAASGGGYGSIEEVRRLFA
ncbi:abscisic acid-deficient protein Aba4 family protein, partial [Nostoc sp. NIES-2111]